MNRHQRLASPVLDSEPSGAGQDPRGEGAALPWLSIIMPVLNEARALPGVLLRLQPWREAGAEIIVADGGSTDHSRQCTDGLVDVFLTAPAGRARQMNAGARCARGSTLLFLHADTVLPLNAMPVLHALLGSAQAAEHGVWGRFDVFIEGRSPWLPVVAFMMNRRSRMTGISTGDQAIFIARALFDAVGGFPDQPLMEDVEICSRLRRLQAPVALRQRVRTSGRRWDANGAWRTITLMWKLRWLYWRGQSPDRLALMYRNSKSG